MNVPNSANGCRATAVAAGATLLAAVPLAAVFQRWTWFVVSVVVVAVVGGVGVLIRSFRHRLVWLPSLAMLGGLGFVLTWLFPSGGEPVRGLPSAATATHFNSLLAEAVRQLPQVGAPVADRPAFLFLAALGVGVTAVSVDLFAVAMHRPALAGLPMLAIYLVPVAVAPDSTSVMMFLPGAAGFLWLVGNDQVARVRRFGQRFTGDGHAVDVGTPLALTAAGRRLALVGVALAVLVPLAVPGMTVGLLHRLPRSGSDVFGGTEAGSGTVNLFAGLSGALHRDRPFVMFAVSTTDPQPHYLRFAVADELHSNGFANQLPTTGQPVTAGIAGPTTGQTTGRAGGSNRYRASVEVRSFNMPYLPVYLQPTGVHGLDGSWRYDPNTSVVYSHRTTAKARMKYEFDYVRADFEEEALRRAVPISSEDPIHRYASVPTRIGAVDALVARLTSGRTGPYEKVLALFDYFATEKFEYRLTTESGTGGSQIEDFLTNKKGFCVQYAAALAWLVRAAGIPARVAVGFTRGNARPGDAVTLTNFNLHAWTEVYFAGFGWVPFDATPAGAVAGLASPAWAPNRRRLDASTGPPDRVPDPNVRTSVQPTVNPSAQVPPDPRPPQAGPPGSAAVASRFWWLLAGVLVLMALAAPALNRRHVRRQRLRRRQYVHAVWDECRDTMIDYRIPLIAAETPRRTAERLIRHAQLTGTAAHAVRVLAEAESYARYARAPVHRADLRLPLTVTRSAIAAQASLRTRVAAVLVPPSVVRRWRLAVRGMRINRIAVAPRLRHTRVGAVR
jgi:transglutaminase-like putative cysteine protease